MSDLSEPDYIAFSRLSHPECSWREYTMPGGKFCGTPCTFMLMDPIWREHPERMQWWANLEQRIGSTFHKSRSYAELGSFVDRQGDWIFDDEAYLCQISEGECAA